MPPFAANWAFFLDIDGTLLDIEGHPDDVRIERPEAELVAGLHRATGGALALVSGRPLAADRRAVPPAEAADRRPARRRAPRRARQAPSPPLPGGGAAPRRRAGTQVRRAHEGLIFEDKGASVALHYRLAPQLQAAALAVVEEAAKTAGGAFEIQLGKMVYELKPSGFDKGSAIGEFVSEAPFAGRIPVFLGDDVTDESGFRVGEPPRRPLGENRRGRNRGALAPGRPGRGQVLARRVDERLRLREGQPLAAPVAATQLVDFELRDPLAVDVNPCVRAPEPVPVPALDDELALANAPFQAGARLLPARLVQGRCMQVVDAHSLRPHCSVAPSYALQRSPAAAAPARATAIPARIDRAAIMKVPAKCSTSRLLCPVKRPVR